MILSIVLLLFVGLIAYLHYIQGLLNGLISAVLAVSAAALAMSYYEPMAAAMSGGKYNDQSQGICLIVLFAGIYLVGRVLFDKLVPGNVRLPHLADAIGGAVCGVVAGLMGTGIVAIALQSMPFGPSIAGYSRYPLSGDRERIVAVPESGSNTNRQVDRVVIDELKNADLEKDQQGLLLPVDDVVVGLAKHLSNGGSLAGDQTFESIHPDLLQEYFGQRIGIEPGAKHTAANNAKTTQVELVQVNVINAPIPKMVGEFPSIWVNPPKGDLVAEGDTYLVTVTVVFKSDAADDDKVVRLGASSVRLVVPTDDGGYKDLYPLGTVQSRKAWLTRPDDYMFIDVSKEDHGANFLFQVDKKMFVGGASADTAKPAAGGKAPAAQSVSVKPGAFIEVKRLAKISLDDAKVVVGWPPPDKKYFPMRKSQFYKDDQPDAPAEASATPAPAPAENPNPRSVGGIASEIKRRGGPDRGAPADGAPTPAPAPTTPTPAPIAGNDWSTAPLEQPALKTGDPLPVGINVGTADADADVVTAAASGHVTGRKFDSLEVDTSADGSALTELPKGGPAVNQLMTPAGKRLVAVTMKVKAGGDPWAWASALGDFTVVDGVGTRCRPSGVIATVTKGGAQRLLASYKATGEVTSVNKLEGGTVPTVTLVFPITADQKAKWIGYRDGERMLPLEP